MPKGGGSGGGGRRGGGGRGVSGGGGSKVLKKLPADYNGVSKEAVEAKKLPGDPTIHPGGKIIDDGKLVQNLPEKQQEAIKAYTGAYVPGGDRFAGLNAEELNRALYDKEGFISTYGRAQYTRALRFKEELDSSLSKVASYRGEVYRVIADNGLSERFVPGKVHTFNEFLSTSRTPRSSYKAFVSSGPGQIRFIIQSKKGKLIEQVSAYGGEKEVLFRSGSSFMITKKVPNHSRGTVDIWMKEI